MIVMVEPCQRMPVSADLGTACCRARIRALECISMAVDLEIMDNAVMSIVSNTS